MSFVKFHPRIEGQNFSPDCTIFNYDTIYFLCDEGPIVYDHTMGGYIQPRLGGRVKFPDKFYFLEALKELKPKKIIIPECYLNGYCPDTKAFFENEVFQAGYGKDQLLVYIQKEQNFYFGEIAGEPEWFYRDHLDDPNKRYNMIYHTTGHNIPSSDKETYDRYSGFRYCQQGFAYETFSKLYHLRNSTPLMEAEKRIKNKSNLIPGKCLFYGNMHTANRPTLKDAFSLSKKLHFEEVKFGDENLNDLYASHRGIGVSMDGLVYATIRDGEYGINCTPSFKVSRANKEIIQKNNLDMFGSRFISPLPEPLSAHGDDLIPYIKALEEAYEKYMDEDTECGYDDIKKALECSRYHYFIALLQKFHNIQFFCYDILFGEDMYDFFKTYLPLDVDFSIFKEAAKPDYILVNDKESMKVDYIKEFITRFDERFKAKYKIFINNE